MAKGFRRPLRTYFITGLVVLLPLAASLYLLWLVFDLAERTVGRLASFILPWEIPGTGLVITLLLIFGIGVFAANIVGRRLIELAENLVFVRIPLLGSIYKSVKQLIDAFSVSGNKGFKQAIVVEWPAEGFYTMGFLTNDRPQLLQEQLGEDVVTVFLPTAPNVTTGFFVTLPRERVRPLDLSVEDAFKTIISSGVFTPDAPSATTEGEADAQR